MSQLVSFTSVFGLEVGLCGSIRGGMARDHSTSFRIKNYRASAISVSRYGTWISTPAHVQQTRHYYHHPSIVYRIKIILSQVEFCWHPCLWCLLYIISNAEISHPSPYDRRPMSCARYTVPCLRFTKNQGHEHLQSILLETVQLTCRLSRKVSGVTAQTISQTRLYPVTPLYYTIPSGLVHTTAHV